MQRNMQNICRKHVEKCVEKDVETYVEHMQKKHAEKYGAIQDLIGNNLIAIMIGEKEMDATLKDVQNKMKKLLR